MEGKSNEGLSGKDQDKEPETCGPLDIKRHIKDDGRELILYTLRERRDR